MSRKAVAQPKGETVVTRKKRQNVGRVLLPYLLVAPSIICLLVFTFYPAINMIYLSFRNYNMVTTDKFIGLRNYETLLFVKKDFWISFENTCVYTVASVFLQIGCGLLLALWLQRDSKLNAITHRVMFFPHICAGLSIAQIFVFLYDRDVGLLNQIIEALGGEGIAWIDSSKYAMMSVIIMNVWRGMGYYALLILSSLKAIPAEINEAAALDNTPAWRKFVRITFPLLTPQLFYLLVTMTIGSFKVFDSIKILTGGGPGTATNVLVQYIYKYGYENTMYGYASAAGTCLLVMLLCLTGVYFKVLDRRVHYQ